jgi:hypothetical protein
LFDCSKPVLGKVADLVDFTLDPATGGYATMKFKFVYNRLLYPATGAIPAGTVLTLTEDGTYPKKSNRPTLLFTKSQIQAGPLTIQVTEALDDAGNPLVQPLTGPEVLAKVFGQDQFSAKVQHVADCSSSIVDGFAEATIDVFSDPTRSKFVNNCGKPSAKYPVAEGGYPNGDNSDVVSAAHILVVDYGDCLRTSDCTLPMVNYGYCVTESGLTFDLTLDSSQENFIQGTTPGNYDGVKLNGSRLFATAPLRGSWTFTGGKFSSIDLRKSAQNELKITVDGTSFLETAEYRVTLALNLPGAGAKSLLSNELAFFWWVNAIKARIPFFILDCTANMNSFVSIGNRATDRAEVWIDGVVTDVTDQKSFPVKSLKPISWKDKFVEPTSVTVLDDCFILNYLSNGNTSIPLDPTHFYRADLTVYVAVTKDQADVSAQQTNGAGSRTTLHVLYEIGNRSDKLRSYQ